jgi:hypothetical protein
MAGRKHQRQRIAGISLFLAIALIGGGTVVGVDARFPAGVAAWLAGILVWPEVSRRARRQAVILTVVGIVAGGCAYLFGGAVAPASIITANAALIAMLAAVGFLRLITSPVAGGDGVQPPTGCGALIRTLLGVHLFGAVVNLSTVFIMGARMTGEGGAMKPDQLRVLTRGFAAAAFWSPFFAAMAAALTFAPGAHVPSLIATGLVCAAAALALSAVTLGRDVEGFVGYPMNWASLWLPFVLAAIVLAVHAVDPTISILGLIAVTAPTLSLVVMLVRREPAVRRFRRHVNSRLPGLANELWLFLAASVIATGLAGLMRALPGWLPFDVYGGPQAAATLVVMVALAMVGVHPVVGIAVVASVLAPLNPDPTLLAMTFLSAWAIGVMASPFGGMNLALQGAYGLTPRDILRANGSHAVALLIIASAVINGYAVFMM